MFLLRITMFSLLCGVVVSGGCPVVKDKNDPKLEKAGMTCDKLIAERPYTCEELEQQHGYDCSGCNCVTSHQACPQTCLFHDCDYWVGRTDSTCQSLSANGCNCSGCTVCGNPNSTAARQIDPDWYWNRDDTCADSKNYNKPGSVDLVYIAGVNNERAWAAPMEFLQCQSMCQRADGVRQPMCAGFQYHEPTKNCTFLRSTTNGGKPSFNPEYECFTYKPRNPGYVPPKPERSTTAAPTICPKLMNGLTCDEFITKFSEDEYTCELMEHHGYNCNGCKCPQPREPVCLKNDCLLHTCDYQIQKSQLDKSMKTCSALTSLGCNCTGCSCVPPVDNHWETDSGRNCLPIDKNAKPPTKVIALDPLKYPTGKMKCGTTTTYQCCIKHCSEDVNCHGFSFKVSTAECTFYDNPVWGQGKAQADKDAQCFLDPARITNIATIRIATAESKTTTVATSPTVPPVTTIQTTVQPTNCQGGFVPPTCQNCDPLVYRITTQATNGGNPCPNADGDMKQCNPGDGGCPTTTTAAPTDAPTNAPTDAPTDAPNDASTDAPNDAPTNAPTNAPKNDGQTDQSAVQTGDTAMQKQTTNAPKKEGQSNTNAKKNKSNIGLGLGLGLGGGIIVIVVIIVVVIVIRNNKRKNVNYSSFVSKRTSMHVEGEDQGLVKRSESEKFQYQPPENFSL